MHWSRYATYLFLAAGTFIVFYFSWIPQPRLGLSDLLPSWLSRWADNDENMNLRTAVPFVFLGSVAAVWLNKTNQPWPVWLLSWLGLTGIAVLAELGQILLPLRHFDWGDIAWGAAGSAGGIIAFGITPRLLKALF